MYAIRSYYGLLIIAVIPGVALSLALYLTDRYDREPFKLLLKVFVFGAISTLPTIVVESILTRLNIFVGVLNAAYSAFIVAGLTEEFFKREVVMRFAFKHPAFNERLDGIIYSAFSALGFATVENIMYVVSGYQANPYIGLMRGVLSVPAHMLFAVTMGYYLSIVKFANDPGTRQHFYKKSLFVPVILHGIFDFILMSNIGILRNNFV